MLTENSNPEQNSEVKPTVETPSVETPVTPEVKPVEDHSGWQKRVDKLTWKAKELERQLQERDRLWEERFKTYEEKANPKVYKDDAERLQAFIDQQVHATLSKKEQEALDTKSYEEKTSKLVSKVQSSIQKSQEMYPDFDDVVASQQEPIPNVAFRFIAKSDFSGPLSYKIAKNPEILEKINDFDDEDDLKRYLTKLELKVESEIEAYEANKKLESGSENRPVVTSPTAKPIEKITPKGSSVKSKDPDPSTNLSEWMKMRNEQERAKKMKQRGGK